MNNVPLKGTLAYVRYWANRTHEALNKRDDVEIGDYTYGNPQIRTGAGIVKCKIGKFCSIASGVSIQLTSDHHSDWISTYDLSVLLQGDDFEKAYNSKTCIAKGNVVIGNNVWICERAIILPGVTIGNGAIIAANCVVTKSVPAYSICAGIPGKIIKKRFSDEEIKILERIQWWNWPEEKILKGLSLIESNSVEDLLKFHEENKEAEFLTVAERRNTL